MALKKKKELKKKKRRLLGVAEKGRMYQAFMVDELIHLGALHLPIDHQRLNTILVTKTIKSIKLR